MRQSKKERIIVILTILPSIIAIGVFVYGFIVWSARVSLADWVGITPNFTFVGLKNYITILSSRRFLIDIVNNIIFSILFVALSTISGLILAILVDHSKKGEGIFRTVYILPMAIPAVVTAVVWKWIFSPSVGVNILLTNFLSKIGVDKIIDFGWYTSTMNIAGFHIALIPIIIAASWWFTGYVMAMYLAGLRGVSSELKEAARVDGASEIKIYAKIVLPLLKPITVSVLIILCYISLKMFDLFYIMTGRGPGYVTDIPSINMYETTFHANKFSQGAVISIVMLLIVVVVIIPYLVISLRKET